MISYGQNIFFFFLYRQLPLIAAQLKGKSQFSFGEMRHKNYIHLFVHILGLLEALQPHIFRKEYKALEDVLECYFSLLAVSLDLCKLYLQSNLSNSKHIFFVWPKPVRVLYNYKCLWGIK